MKHLIVGNGAAGAFAAEAIRQHDPQAAIVVLEREPHPFYYRPRLTEVLSGQVEPERIVLRDAAWYAQRGMDLRLGVEVVGLDPQAHTVTTADGQTLAYDRLLLAMGAQSRVPPLAGVDLDGVCTLRAVDDYRTIRRAAADTDRAVCLGGGLLGLEAACGLARLGLAVTVVEGSDQLLPRQLDPRAAELLRGLLEAKGISFALGARGAGLWGEERVRGLELTDGRRLESGLVLISAGISVNAGLAKAAGCHLEQGVVVDDSLRTSVADVWCAGDLAQHRGRVYGLWSASQEQGKAAGAAMAGREVAYQGTQVPTILKVAGVDMASAGTIAPGDGDQTHLWQKSGVYRKLVSRQGRLVGFIFVGTTQGLAQCRKALAQGWDLTPHVGRLADPDFDFNLLAPTA